jgi:hypothetical protein
MGEDRPGKVGGEMAVAATVDPVLTTTKAAAQLGYGEVQVRNMCAKGAFPNAYRNGPSGQWRIPFSDVQAFREKSRPRRRTRVLKPDVT